MLRETDDVFDEVSLFTVVKSVLENGELSLRLIVDNRTGNLSWRVPPWSGWPGWEHLQRCPFEKGFSKVGSSRRRRGTCLPGFTP